DADKDTPTAHAERVSLTRGSLQHDWIAKQRDAACCVVAQEVHCLAHFGDGIRHRLAGLEDAKRQEFRSVALEKVCGAPEYLCALGCRTQVPASPGIDRNIDRIVDRLRICGFPRAD